MGNNPSIQSVPTPDPSVLPAPFLVPKAKGMDPLSWPSALQAEQVESSLAGTCGRSGAPTWKIPSGAPPNDLFGLLKAYSQQGCWNIDGPGSSTMYTNAKDTESGQEGGKLCQFMQPDMKDIMQCCLGIKDDVKTCLNRYCPTSADCKQLLSYHCSNPDNVASSQCRAFCTAEGNKPYCDDAMQSYCAISGNERKAVCSCISSGIIAPSCFDVNCMSSGYQTSDMARQAKNCPAFCGVIIKCVTDGTCEITNIDLDIVCKGKASAQQISAIQAKIDAKTAEVKAKEGMRAGLSIAAVGGAILLAALLCVYYTRWTPKKLKK